MTTFSVREAVPADSDAIAAVHRASRQEAMPFLPDLHTPEEDRWWVANVVLPNQYVLVAEVDGAIVAMAAMTQEMLEHLYVAPGYQGCGIGSALLSSVIERAPDRLELWAFQQNERARAFYERRGFVAVEFTDGQDNEEKLPDVRYRLAKSTSGDY